MISIQIAAPALNAANVSALALGGDACPVGYFAAGVPRFHLPIAIRRIVQALNRKVAIEVRRVPSKAKEVGLALGGCAPRPIQSTATATEVRAIARALASEAGHVLPATVEVVGSSSSAASAHALNAFAQSRLLSRQYRCLAPRSGHLAIASGAVQPD